MAKTVKYSSRNYADIRNDLFALIRQYYPDILNDFNDSSVGVMLIELNAAVGDMLSHNQDKSFGEVFIDHAGERKSLMNLARNNGVKVPNKRPSATIVDFSVTVPVMGDTFDVSYSPVIRAGTQVTGGGKVFEVVDDIDFSSPFASDGSPNRLILPNFNGNNILSSYTLVKREIVVNGYTKLFKRVINTSDVKPFFQVVLPENDVISVDSVITLDGTDYTKEPSLDQFTKPDNRWYEVDALAERQVFIEDNTVATDNVTVSYGKWVNVDRKFVTEYTDKGFTKITFGGGQQDISALYGFTNNKYLIDRLSAMVEATPLGETPTANTTMFIRYRVGGGSDTNIGSNVLTSTGIVNMAVNGSDVNVNKAVRSSLKVNNPFPAIGGKDQPSLEELRWLTKYNFSAQNRCVTIADYITRVGLMPSRFGTPYRYGVIEEQNKICVYVLALDADGKLSTQSTNVMSRNITNYLANFRGNDYVVVKNGRVVNVSFEFDLYISKDASKTDVASKVSSLVRSFMDVSNFQMGDSVYLSSMLEKINNVGGVLNVNAVRVYNKVGGKYSVNEIMQPYSDMETRQVDISDMVLFGTPTSMFEIKYPESDIKIRFKE